jgi:hypothetical protein
VVDLQQRAENLKIKWQPWNNRRGLRLKIQMIM